MGGGSWTRDSFKSYARDAYGSDVDKDGRVSRNISVNDACRSSRLSSKMNPYGVKFRECCESPAIPHTIPIMLFVDETGSMGNAAIEVAKSLGEIMNGLTNRFQGIEVCAGAIGDMEYNEEGPLQVGQFESDIRIAEQFNDIYFEGLGGGNAHESYTAAWYFAANHTKLDCWARGKKGILITLGDEPINPILTALEIKQYIGDDVQKDFQAEELYRQVSEKYHVFHIHVNHRYINLDLHEWKTILGQNYRVSSIDDLKDTIVEIVSSCVDESADTPVIIPDSTESASPWDALKDI